MTLDVLKLSGWWKAVARCRVERRVCGAGRGGGPGGGMERRRRKRRVHGEGPTKTWGAMARAVSASSLTSDAEPMTFGSRASVPTSAARPTSTWLGLGYGLGLGLGLGLGSGSVISEMGRGRGQGGGEVYGGG